MSPENYRYRTQTKPCHEITDPIQTTRDFYSDIYQRDKSDSPDRSRINLVKRARFAFAHLGNTDLVLDLGAGRQIFEREYLNVYGKPACRLVTLDIAEITCSKLLVSPFLNIDHLKASGAVLPLRSESFSAVVSNMALDFMPESARNELCRVMKPGAAALINLHHPSLIPEDLDQLLAQRKLSKNKRTIYLFWKYLRDNDMLFSDPTKIKTAFSSYGFNVERISEAVDCDDKWWEIDLTKPPKSLEQYDIQKSVDRIIGPSLSELELAENMNA